MKTSAYSFLALIFVATIFSTRINAQEQQVALDSAGTLMQITPQDNQKLKMFDEYLGFKLIRLFQKADSTYFLEVIYENNNMESRRQIPMVAKDVQELRQRITDAESTTALGVGLNQEGRPSFLLFSTVAALVYYGPAFTAVTASSDISAASLTYVVGGVGGFLIPYLITQDISMTQAQSSLARIGMMAGVTHSYLGFMLLAGNEGLNSEASARGCIALSIAGGIYGTALGINLAPKHHISEGRAEAIGSLWTDALVIGNGLSYSLGVLDAINDVRPFAAYELALSAAGLYGAIQLSALQDFTAADAHMMSLPSYLGGGLALSLLPYFDHVNDGLAVASVVTGYGLGTYLGWNMIKDRNYESKHYVFTALSTFGGALVGGAFGIAAGDSKITPLLMDLGGFAGYLIMANLNSRETAAPVTASKTVDFQLQLNTGGVAQLMKNPERGAPQLLSAQLRF